MEIIDKIFSENGWRQTSPETRFVIARHYLLYSSNINYAQAFLHEAAEVFPAASLNLLGYLDEKNGDTNKALFNYRSAFRNNTNELYPALNILLFFLKNENYPAARSYVSKLAGQFPGNHYLHMLHTLIALKTGHIAEAENYLNLSVLYEKNARETAQYYLYYAMLLELKNEPDKALRYLYLGQTIEPDNLVISYRIKKILNLLEQAKPPYELNTEEKKIFEITDAESSRPLTEKQTKAKITRMEKLLTDKKFALAWQEADAFLETSMLDRESAFYIKAFSSFALKQYSDCDKFLHAADKSRDPQLTEKILRLRAMLQAAETRIQAEEDLRLKNQYYLSIDGHLRYLLEKIPWSARFPVPGQIRNKFLITDIEDLPQRQKDSMLKSGISRFPKKMIHFKDGVIYSYEEYIYSGSLLMETSVYSADNDFLRRLSYQYQAALLTNEIEYDKKNTILSRTVYQHDNLERLTRREKYNRDGQLAEYETYTGNITDVFLSDGQHVFRKITGQSPQETTVETWFGTNRLLNRVTQHYTDDRRKIRSETTGPDGAMIGYSRLIYDQEALIEEIYFSSDNEPVERFVWKY